MRSARLAVFCVALLSSPAFGQLSTFFPRNGLVGLNAPDSHLAMVVADSDEGLLVSPLSEFDLGVSIMTPVYGDSYGPPLLRSLTEAPHQLDNGDYAVAVGLVRFDPAIPTFFVLESFLQLRLAGSSATALTGVAGTPNNIGDPYTFLDDTIVSLGGLASVATAEGLWSSPTDYIEFSPSDALVFSLSSSPAGPQDWIGSVFPEPGTASLVALAVLGPALGLRRR
ncbi:hypothetical protein [Botrimarina mediterranea]|uniref:PEP-CTERM protein-sorting domain-containing protein n=1 Tax=Botrimarina mediterranea TaxID=2528022 RepID=A0A518K450_9BACT|nr:hypothetical protein [Botrimarina mediterranea]QDV72578.1 hypothetical protein Spa11_07570 [Botrimarina mediterranea]QDV77150.1 hypothetical protein K2D_07380 [Planctomycetes bacterium K2D]